MIFSQSVIGRGAVVISGGETSPARRALLYVKSPPYSTTSALMRSRPLVNSETGISSPRATRSRTPKSVVVKRPMFWQFCP